MDAVAENDRAEIRRRLHVVRKTHYAAPSAGGIGMKCFCDRMGAVNTGERGNDGVCSGKAVRMLFVGAPDGRLFLWQRDSLNVQRLTSTSFS